MALFDKWEDVAIEPGKRGLMKMAKHRVKFRRDHKGYFRLSISSDLIRESGSEQFTLKTNGSAYALIPDQDGRIVHRAQHTLGITSNTIEKMAENLGGTEFDACVIDGSIVFPKEKIFKNQ